MMFRFLGILLSQMAYKKVCPPPSWKCLLLSPYLNNVTSPLSLWQLFTLLSSVPAPNRYKHFRFSSVVKQHVLQTSNRAQLDHMAWHTYGRSLNRNRKSVLCDCGWNTARQEPECHVGDIDIYCLTKISDIKLDLRLILSKWDYFYLRQVTDYYHFKLCLIM